MNVLSMNGPNTNVLCTVMRNKLTGLRLFLKLTVTSNVFLGMLENYILPLKMMMMMILTSLSNKMVHLSILVSEFMKA
jgi:hypothetical protein